MTPTYEQLQEWSQRAVEELQDIVNDGNSNQLQNTQALIEDHHALVQDVTMADVRSDTGPHGAKVDQMKADLEMLLDNAHVSAKEIKAICKSLENVDIALEQLYEHTEKFMMHKTAGHCFGLRSVGRNSLLSMLMSIQDSQITFSQGIRYTIRRIRKVLSGKDQQDLFA